MCNSYSGFILHDPGKSWKQDAGFKKIKFPEIFLAAFKFQNVSLFCFPVFFFYWCSSKLYKLQTGVLYYIEDRY